MAKAKKTSEEANISSQELTVTKKNKTQVNDPISLMTPKELSLQIVEETSKRALVTDFIKHHLKSGTDYGKIHISKTCQNKYNCTNSYHFSKDVLFKPGAEKFCSLFKLRAEFKKDTETWEMLGSKSGELAYLCGLYTTNNVLVGEGRGVASVSEKGNANTAVKIAEKRAKLDAVLSTGALSDFFTQDLEDMQPGAELEAEDVVVETKTVEILPSEPIRFKKPTVSDKSKISYLCKLLGIDGKPDTKNRIETCTALEFEEKNYPEIVRRLEAIVNERNEAKKSDEAFNNL